MRRLWIMGTMLAMTFAPWAGYQARTLWHAPTKPLPHAAAVQTLPAGCAPAIVLSAHSLYTVTDVYAGRFIALPAPNIAR